MWKVFSRQHMTLVVASDAIDLNVSNAYEGSPTSCLKHLQAKRTLACAVMPKFDMEKWSFRRRFRRDRFKYLKCLRGKPYELFETFAKTRSICMRCHANVEMENKTFCRLNA